MQFAQAAAIPYDHNFTKPGFRKIKKITKRISQKKKKYFLLVRLLEMLSSCKH